MPGSYSPFARRAYALPPVRGHKPPAPSKGAGWWLSESALDLDFGNNRAFNRSTGFNGSPNGILTYTSPSPKLVYGDDGVLRYAPHNLLLQSEAFATSPWADTIGGTGVAPTVTADAGNDPNGNPTADRIQFSLAGGTATTDISRRRQSITVIATPHTFSVYLRSYDGSSTYNMHLTDPAGATRNIVVTGSWQRFEVFATATGTAVTYSVGLRGGQIPANSNTADVLAWGAQLNAGSSALTYIPTTTAAVYSLPIDHDPTTFEPLGVLIEEQRTNLLLQSQTFDNATWLKSGTNTAATANAAVAPDGTTTADLLIPGTTAANHDFQQTPTAAAVSYTLSVYAKAENYSWVCLTYYDGAVDRQAYFNVLSGVIGSVYNSPGAVIQSVGNGWYRVSITFTGVVGRDQFLITPCPSDGGRAAISNGTSGVYVWGAQLEAGAFATSYIPTVASQVTRARDDISILTSAFGYNASEGSLVTEADTNQMSGSLYSYVASFGDGTANERMVSRSLNTTFNFAVVDGGVTQASNNLSPVALSTMYKAAFAYKQNDFAVTLDGGVVGTDVSGTVPTVTTLKLGADSAAGATLNGHIKRLTYFSTRKTDSELQALSA